MSQIPKIAGFLETSEADLTLSIALGSRALSASTCDCQRAAKNRHTSAPADQGAIVAFGELGVCDGGHG